MNLLKRIGGDGSTVGVPVVLGAALASVAPLLVEGGVIPGALANGLTALPWVFAGVFVVLMLFKPGFVAMTEHTPTGGGLASIVTAGLGPVYGAVAWYIALVAYGLLQVALYGLAGTQFASFFASYGHIQLSWWAWALIVWGLVSVASQFKLKWIGIVLILFTTGEVVVSVLLSGGALVAAGHASTHALTSGHPSLSGLSASFPVCVLGFVGFELTALYKLLVRNPRRTVNRATTAALVTPAVLFVAASWAIVAHDGGQTAALAAQGPGAYFGISDHVESVAANVLLNTSLLGGLIGYNQGWVRYAYNGARVGMMPQLFERTTARGIHFPLTVLQSACGLAAIGLTCWRGWDPFQQFFYVGGTLDGYGVLWLLALTSISVAVHFRRERKKQVREAGVEAAAAERVGFQRESVWVSSICPAVSAALLLAMAVLASWHFSLMIGVAPSDPMAKVLPLSYLVIALIGLGWVLRVRRRSPQKYQGLSGPPTPELAVAAGVISQEA